MKTRPLLILTAVIWFSVATYVVSQTGENLPAFSNKFQVGTAPVTGTNCIQTATLGATITGGTFRLKSDGATTAPITWVGENRALIYRIATALNALDTIGAGNCAVSVGTMTAGAGGTFLVTLTNNRGNRVEPAITVANNSLTGAAHTLTIAITTAGVEADCRICPKGASVVTADTGDYYKNIGVPLHPNWIPMGQTVSPTPTPSPTGTATITPTPTVTATSTPTATATATAP